MSVLPSSSSAKTTDASIRGRRAVNRRLSPSGDQGGKTLAVLELDPAEPVARPDVLLYWSVEPVGERPGDDALLLGAFGGERRQGFVLPEEAVRRDGHLTLLSLGHGEVVARGVLPAVRPSAEDPL